MNYLPSSAITSEQAAFRSRICCRITDLASKYLQQVNIGVPLQDLTTFRIGGRAQGVCRIRTIADAQKFQAFAREQDVPVAILGGGSNILADDRGFCGLVLHLENDLCTVHGDVMRVGAGLNFDRLIEQSLATGLCGLEFASGIPGTLGGAVVGNAGCYGHEISEFVHSATLLRADGRLQQVGPEDLVFAYRSSALKQSGDILLEVELKLNRGDTTAAWRTRQEKIEIRRRKHPVRRPCAGSFFKNLPPARPGGQRRAAGELLEKVGAKTMREGDAAVYEKHANIIVNEGQATCSQVLALADRMQEAVREHFGVTLYPEVRYLPWILRAS